MSAPLVRSLAPGIFPAREAADLGAMDGAGRSRVVIARGVPRLLEDCAAIERLIGGDLRPARERLDSLLGHELAGLLHRALLPGPRPTFVLTF